MGTPLTGVLNAGVMKNWDFQQLSRFISEMIDRAVFIMECE